MMAKMRLNREPVEYGAEVYLPINLEAVRVDTVPDFDLYFRPGHDKPFVLYCEKKSRFTNDARRRLATHRIEQLYIKKADAAEYHRYLADNIQDILSDKRLSLREKSSILYDSAQAVVEVVLANPSSREHVRRGKNIVGNTVDFMTDEEFKLEHLLRTISCDAYLYTHSVNVVAYSVALAMRAGHHDKPILREIANGALMHDVGKSKVDPEILNKPGGLTTAEWEEIQQVPRLGYDMMRASDCLGEIALDIVLHHQEKLDGSGYPDALKGDQISEYVRIVTIADVFDALTSDRFHQSPRGTFEALQVMQREMRNQLDPELFKTFVNMMGNP